MKHRVDSFRPGQKPPSCCLSVEWTRDVNPVKLKHRKSLLGAMEPFNFFYIKCIPESAMEGRKMISIYELFFCWLDTSLGDNENTCQCCFLAWMNTWITALLAEWVDYVQGNKITCRNIVSQSQSSIDSFLLSAMSPTLSALAMTVTEVTYIWRRSSCI